MTIALSTICESIASLNYSGVKVLDLSEMPEGVLPRDCPVLFPEPVNFVTGLTAAGRSFQRGLGSKWELHYQLHYKFCYCPVSADRGLNVYADMVTKAMGIVNVILKATVDVSGATSLKLADALNFGAVTDPSGAQFLGCEIVLDVLDIQEPA